MASFVVLVVTGGVGFHEEQAAEIFAKAEKLGYSAELTPDPYPHEMEVLGEMCWDGVLTVAKYTDNLNDVPQDCQALYPTVKALGAKAVHFVVLGQSFPERKRKKERA